MEHTWTRCRSAIEILVRNLKNRHYVGDPSIELMTMLKWILKKDGVCGLDSAD
jgi:hypothetical protein